MRTNPATASIPPQITQLGDHFCYRLAAALNGKGAQVPALNLLMASLQTDTDNVLKPFESRERLAMHIPQISIPASMTSKLRVVEIARLLATGLVRLRAKMDPDSGVSLAMTADQSVHEVPKRKA